MTFEEELMRSIKYRILDEVKKTDYTRPNYNDRKVIPRELINQIWESINWSEVIDQIRPDIQTRIARVIVGSMGTELKTDIKKLLAVEGVRERLRIEVYPKLMNVLNDQ